MIRVGDTEIRFGQRVQVARVNDAEKTLDLLLGDGRAVRGVTMHAFKRIPV